MNALRIPFASFRVAGQDDFAISPGSPAGVLAARLREAGVPFEIARTRMGREEAATHPETADFYPAGPDSGPACVLLFEFLTTQEAWGRASEIAEPHD